MRRKRSEVDRIMQWFENTNPDVAQAVIEAVTGILRRRIEELASPAQEDKPKRKRKARTAKPQAQPLVAKTEADDVPF